MKKKSASQSAFFKLRLLIAVLLCFGAITLVLFAQPRTPPANRAVSQPIVRAQYLGVMPVMKFDISPPLRSMKPLTSKEVHAARERGTGADSAAPLGPVVPDTAVQRVIGKIGIPAPIISFDGNSNLCGCSPPDPNGAVGPNHVVTMSNLHFQIFNKSGQSLFGPAANNTLWSWIWRRLAKPKMPAIPLSLRPLADRWLLSQFTAGSAPFFECVALSQTNDPTGCLLSVGHCYRGQRKQFSGLSESWDVARCVLFQHAGVCRRHWRPFAGVGAYALDRVQALAGNPNPTMVGFLPPPNPAYVVGDGLLPSDLDGDAHRRRRKPKLFCRFTG